MAQPALPHSVGIGTQKTLLGPKPEQHIIELLLIPVIQQSAIPWAIDAAEFSSGLSMAKDADAIRVPSVVVASNR